ncbi:helix-turn-helix domain-containing protein [Streptococcus porcinus]|uniref:Helix-turn-helix domain-containing protein n=1 Tax=Streptococcus porcinus TaxID=1340 RepID=A0A7V9WSJ6_STRPO|nr:helix-turn-helix domain-containing protein [Streptococcus porcinus]MBA2796273.1 helix-turn-helix domain-containing protein [Streptococcus porcinus]
MELKEYFPKSQVNHLPFMGEDWVTIAEDDHYIHLPKETLTARELFLLGKFDLLDYVAKSSASPWQDYLLLKKGPLPEPLSHFQFIFLEHKVALAEDLLDLFKSLIPSLVAIVHINKSRTTLLVDQSQESDFLSLFADILPTIESDFGIALSVFIGNNWLDNKGQGLSGYFDEENLLLTAYQAQKGEKQLFSFSELLLWGMLTQLDLPMLEKHFYHHLVQNKEVSDLVLSLWQCQGNLVQTAQKLYIHRNSLQYKLEKTKRQTGLNLKNLDDLTFAYLFIQKQ